MKSKALIMWLFVVAALYDGVLGILFLFAPRAIFRWANVTEPNHFGYVQFPAALLIIFAFMFAAIARAPSANRKLIVYGVFLKLSYCTVAFGYWFTEGIPGIWKPFAVFDLVFLALFIVSYLHLSKQQVNQGI